MNILLYQLVNICIPSPCKNIALHVKSGNLFNSVTLSNKHKANLWNNKESVVNYARTSKHYLPINKEWSDSICVYNGKNSSMLPALNRTTWYMIKSYFDSYAASLYSNIATYAFNKKNNEKIRSYILKKYKNSINRIFVSRPEIKHTSDKVQITVYIYDQKKRSIKKRLRRNSYLNQYMEFRGRYYSKYSTLEHKCKKLVVSTSKYILTRPYFNQGINNRHNTISKLYKLYANMNLRKAITNKSKHNLQYKALQVRTKKNNNHLVLKKRTHNRYRRLEMIPIIRNNAKKLYYIRRRAELLEKRLYKQIMTIQVNNAKLNKTCNITPVLINNIYEKCLLDYVNKTFARENYIMLLKQRLTFDKMKFQECYAKPLLNQLSLLYNKKVELNFVNLKYIYLNSSILSQFIALKLNNRKNKLVAVLRKTKRMFKTKKPNSVQVYKEMYNKILVLQKPSLASVQLNRYRKTNVKTTTNIYDVTSPHHTFLGAEQVLTSGILVNKTLLPSTPMRLVNQVLANIKYKYINGIRVAVSGRLSRRNTASRSVHKVSYRGNLRNRNSSDKGLSSYVARGYANSNLQYTVLHSKVRTGSFGVKTWVSGA